MNACDVVDYMCLCMTVNKFNYAITILLKIEINKLETKIVKQYKITMSQFHNVLLSYNAYSNLINKPIYRVFALINISI